MSSVATRFFIALRHAWHWFFTVGLIWLLQTGVCSAQGLQKETKPKSYVMSYVIIMLAVAGALFVICRPGKRDDRVKKS
ncbi:MAG: hypothetical protein GY768_28545 [Planctomycetaceae bacterium]|nr:hypothetical protein [Planctomycetaceae bacterium]